MWHDGSIGKRLGCISLKVFDVIVAGGRGGSPARQHLQWSEGRKSLVAELGREGPLKESRRDRVQRTSEG